MSHIINASSDEFFLQETEGDEADLAELRSAGFLDDDDFDDDEADQIDPELEAELADFFAAAEADPTKPEYAKGEVLWVGLDAEWVFDPALQRNRILTIQLHVPPEQQALSKDENKRAGVARLSRLIEARSGAVEDRPRLQQSLNRLIEEALEGKLIADEPKVINVVGFGLRFDMAALGDFTDLKTQIDSVAGKLATVHANAKMEFSRTLVSGDGSTKVLIGLRFIDVAAHVPPGTSLRDIGYQIGLEKIDIPKPYSIERMDEYLRERPEGFRAYAMRDAEIAVHYAMRLSGFAERLLDVQRLPPTASGLALRWCMSTFKQAGIDVFDAFGLHRVKRIAYHGKSKKTRTTKEVEPTPMRRIQEAFLTDCYAGGRNESFFIGPSPVGVWRDFDLAGAYSTGLMDLPLIDFDRPRSSVCVDDYLGHVAGYALIEFKHPADTRYPVFAISRGVRGLVFPLEGTTYATAPEIRAAHDLKCEINIRWGVIFPWKSRPDEEKVDGVPVQRLFKPFVLAARKLRHELKERNGGVDTLESLAAKLYANSVYGKISQSLRPKNVFDVRHVRTVQLKPSPITNPAIAAHVTGFIRAILAEILNRTPRHRRVLSVTTDGFITDALPEELDLTGPLCRRFQGLCDDLAQVLVDEDGNVPEVPMLEIKHEVGQVVCMKTRGQLTGQTLYDADKQKDKKIILARAGVQVAVDIPPKVGIDKLKQLQNQAMLNLYLARTPTTMTQVGQFPSIRDQCEKGIDLHKFVREMRLSLEFDMKRRPVAGDELMVRVVDHGGEHIALDTRPWRTVAEFDTARAVMDGWRREHCLITAPDWESLEFALEMDRIRRKLRESGLPTINIGKEEPLWGMLLRAFLRAYTHDALGLRRKELTYRNLAAWLTESGYPTTQGNVSGARNQEPALGCVPKVGCMMPLLSILKARFPDADLDQLMASD